ncbi:MAG: DUF2069 domain-containing protein [Proteobacteria bacterium]|nr:DUF2069 domain-containing protein [Pseudomonadota bacterium]MDA1330986.1 DUF2069 domain-containing protein [Pseudomonadota bacterium]
MIRPHQILSSGGLIVLSLWCLIWEGYAAPLTPDGSWLILKSIPIVLPLLGILRNNLRTYQYTVLIVFPYFIEGVVRSYAEIGIFRFMAVGEITLSLLIFAILLNSVRIIRTQG